MTLQTAVFSGRSLPGQTGSDQDRQRIARQSTHRPGALVYGPYLLLRSAEYDIHLKYSASGPDSALWDVIYQGTSVPLKKGNLSQTNSGWLRTTIDARNQHTSRPALEVRVWYTGSGTVSIEELRITERLNTGPLFAVAVLAFVVTIVLYSLSVASSRRSRLSSITPEWKAGFTEVFLIVGFFGGVCYHYIMGAYLGYAFPLDTFLNSPHERFSDFHNIMHQIRGDNFSPEWPFKRAPVTGHLVLYPFSTLPVNISFALFLIISILSLLLICSSSLKTTNKVAWFRMTFVFTFMTYPFLFGLDRGNIEILGFVCLCLFMACYCRGKFFLSILFLAMATYLKIFPGIFALLLFADKRYKEFGGTILLFVSLSVLGIAVYPGNFMENVARHFAVFQTYNEIYVIGSAGLAYGHSLFGLIKVVFKHLDPDAFSQTHNILLLMRIYFILSVGLFLALSGYLISVKDRLWKRAAILVFAMNLLPYVSADYKLVYTLLPLFLLVRESAAEPRFLVYLFLLSVLLIPMDYYRLGASDVSISVVVYPLSMLICSVLIVTEGLDRGSITNRRRPTFQLSCKVHDEKNSNCPVKLHPLEGVLRHHQHGR